jgi:hypothetical protein
MRKYRFPATTLILLFAVCGLLTAQTLNNVINRPPTTVVLSFLLTDGSVMFQGRGWSDWYKLTPDNRGKYTRGTWSQLASLPAGYAPFEFTSAVLADGRVVIVGGEYNNGNFVLTNQGAIYDPKADTWTMLPTPPGWTYIGDSPSVVLPNGEFMVGNKLLRSMAILDPVTLTWRRARSKGKNDYFAEEGWTLLPDGSILTADVRKAPNSERYTPSTGEWNSAGSTVANLRSPHKGLCIPLSNGNKYCPPGEIGPAMLLPDGTVFATGSGSGDGTGAGHTAIYQPSTGTWTPGPDFPNGDDAGDSFAVLLPSGNVLVLGVSGRLYEFDGVNLIPTVQAPGSLLTLPTGQVLVGGDPVQVYTSAGTYSPAWAPTITSCPNAVTRGSTYQIFGTQFNGLSQAAAFGDEFQRGTNYPLVRITNHDTHHVFFARTHGHSTMAVATGSATVSTNFDVGSDIEPGASSLEVVANGIPSLAINVTVN